MKTSIKLLTLALAVAGAAQTSLAQTTVPNVITYQGRVNVGGQPFTGNGQFKFALVSAGTNTSQQAYASVDHPGGMLGTAMVYVGGSGYTTAPAISFNAPLGGSGGTATATVAGGAVTGITINNPGSGYVGLVDVVIAPPPVVTGGFVSYWSHDGTGANGGQPTSAVTLPVANGLFVVGLGDTNAANITALPANVATNDSVRLRLWFNDGTNGFAQLTPDQPLTAAPYALLAQKAVQLDGSTLIVPSQLAPGAAAANLAASGQAPVPSGGMILSSNAANANLLAAGYVKLGRTDLPGVWNQPGTSGAPAARSGHTAVWTGSEMIVWGGLGGDGSSRFNDGGRYNPTANSWSTLPGTTLAGRSKHTAVWTGSEMIVWGGHTIGGNLSNDLNDGGRYNPVGNSWTNVTTSSAPAARNSHTAVWTGSEMIVWGGFWSAINGSSGYLNDGGRYNPVGNSWTNVPTSGAPAARDTHTAVWTGSEMIVWGGQNNGSYFNNGGRYNPVGNSWSLVPTTGAPAMRAYHTAVWAGSEMIVWGDSITAI